MLSKIRRYKAYYSTVFGAETSFPFRYHIILIPINFVSKKIIYLFIVASLNKIRDYDFIKLPICIDKIQ